jgi:hypothetical protein
MGDLYWTVTPEVVPSAARVLLPITETEREADPVRGRSQRMDGIRELLDAARSRGLVTGHFRGLLHIAIGRRVTMPDGTLVSAGLTWREIAAILKQLRFDRELVRELGADPDKLAPRDRQRFWYAAIALAKVDSPEAVAQAEAITGRLKDLGFVIGPSPTAAIPPPPVPAPAAAKGKTGNKPKSKGEKQPASKPARRKKKG